MELSDLGWNYFFEEKFRQFESRGLSPGRIVREDRQMYLIYCRQGEVIGEVSGRFRYEAESKSGFPAVGDWVGIVLQPDESKAIIHQVLPRRSYFRRKVAGSRTEEQVIAANIDTVFVVSGLDGGRNFNIRRMERYFTLCWDSGATPIIVLNKADLCRQTDEYIRQAESVGFGIPIHVVSAVRGDGLDALRGHISRGKTIALLGPSGVGKSALVNALLGTPRQITGEVRDDDLRGRHTTTRRELIILADGGMIIDTPGLRELQLWTDDDNLSGAFGDIAELAQSCRFRNCRHQREPDCAVRAALGQGEIDAGRFDSYLRLQRELAYLERRRNQKIRLTEKKARKRKDFFSE